MNITYIASSGNVYPLITKQIRLKNANFHAWEFKAESTELVYGSRVSQFRKQSPTYQATIVIRGNPIARMAVLNALHDDFENDLRKLQPGKIIWGEWYCDCYITASETVPSGDVKHWTENSIDIFIPSGFWAREETKHFDIPSAPASEFLEYPYGYEYDYTPTSNTATTWETDSPFESDFEMRIYGPCVNPRVIINGYPYLVNVAVPEGSTLIINSKNHTVMMGGENCFDLRNKVTSVFQKIPAGALSVSYGGFAFDLTLFEERSEPKW